MKVSDFIVWYLEKAGVEDVFGYPGGMITHLMESLSHSKKIKAHLAYNEQGAAMAAVGYVQASNKPVMVFTSSGPGATNLMTGLCNAWFDSVPVLFITGNVNTYEARGNHNVRQKGFQEAEIVDMVKGVTKYAVKLESVEDVEKSLDTAFRRMYEGRPGPSLLDIPMNITRGQIEPSQYPQEEIQGNAKLNQVETSKIKTALEEALNESRRPVLLLGNGIHICGIEDQAVKMVHNLKLPVVTSLPASDLLARCMPYSQGFIGAYGKRAANIILEKADLVISIGSRLDNRQTGTDVNWFATNAKLIRFEIDPEELGLIVKKGERQFNCDIRTVLTFMANMNLKQDYSEWRSVCSNIQELLRQFDKTPQLSFLSRLLDRLPENSIITTDVGQNQIWIPQAMSFEKRCRILFSAGFGAMGYSLPSAIGAAISTKKPIYCFNGDGGIQMNIQELQFVVRERLPIKIIVLNNSSLGMIRHFQELYFNNNNFMTDTGNGYSAPDFVSIATAYGIPAVRAGLDSVQECIEFMREHTMCLIEIDVGNPTYVEPKSIYNKPLAYQIPSIPEKLQDLIMKL